jgi:hypothetical protein
MTKEQYSSTADELVNRITALLPLHPEILEMESAFDLFKLPGFKCDGLQPSLFQASWALNKAKATAKARGGAEGSKS